MFVKNCQWPDSNPGSLCDHSAAPFPKKHSLIDMFFSGKLPILVKFKLNRFLSRANRQCVAKLFSFIKVGSEKTIYFPLRGEPYKLFFVSKIDSNQSWEETADMNQEGDKQPILSR